MYRQQRYLKPKSKSPPNDKDPPNTKIKLVKVV